MDAAQDPAYTARLEPPALAGAHDYVVSVSKAESVVTGVGMCLRVAMTGMPEMAVIGWARRRPQTLKARAAFGGPQVMKGGAARAP